ncbi:MAG: hypothetical protein KA214_10695, partial [Neisseriaceae bacterium]|nr:hypothetical protein [Neisseriaceae bacterium]
MIHIYQNTAPGAFQVIEHIQPNSWVQLLSPSADEVNHVAKTLAVPIEFLTAVQNRDQRPRMDTQEGHTLLIVHVPYNDPAVQNNHDEVKYRTIP